MDALGLERIEINNLIIKGMKWKENHSEKWHANMGGIECVFLKNDGTIFVITVYENGGKK